MKKLNYISIVIILLSSIHSFAQEKNSLLLNLAYFNNNNNYQYLTAQAKTRVDGKFQMVPGVELSFYITSESPSNLLGKAITNDNGYATVMIPPSAKEEWNKAAKQTFVVTSSASKLYDAGNGTVDVTKAKIKIDTAADKKITATLYELKDTAWIAVKGIDLKVAVKRLDGDLNVSETPTYTTDSLGSISADFKRDSLPGDSKGNLTLVARLEDNELYGNLTAEKVVPWGSVTQYTSEFDKRTLFARRGKSPLWLEFMAYSIVAGVWGVLIYLFFQIKKMKSFGV